MFPSTVCSVGANQVSKKRKSVQCLVLRHPDSVSVIYVRVRVL